MAAPRGKSSFLLRKQRLQNIQGRSQELNRGVATGQGTVGLIIDLESYRRPSSTLKVNKTERVRAKGCEKR